MENIKKNLRTAYAVSLYLSAGLCAVLKLIQEKGLATPAEMDQALASERKRLVTEAVAKSMVDPADPGLRTLVEGLKQSGLLPNPPR